MEDVIKLPVTEHRAPAKKRARDRRENRPKNEERKRQRNVRRLSVLGEEDSSVRLLEELLFGAEERLVERLVEEEQEEQEQEEQEQEQEVAAAV